MIAYRCSFPGTVGSDRFSVCGSPALDGGEARANERRRIPGVVPEQLPGRHSESGLSCSAESWRGQVQDSKSQRPHSSGKSCLLTLLHQLERKRIG